MYNKYKLIERRYFMIRNLRKVSTASDSIGITIPKYIVDILNLNPDDEVDIELKGTKIIISTNITNEGKE
jgi:antitoxin component of MazEF toxin-antitoxin module